MSIPSIRALSSSPPTSWQSPAKRPRLDEGSVLRCTRPISDFKDGLMLAPMVRSGSLPTRLFALKHGAKLVWGPEIIDKAILHAEREVDPVSGSIHYNGVSKAIFSCHPVEKPYLIYQIGSSNPDLAVQAAKTVQQDVSGIDLNCGCPKPFSTHAGMGAALLTNPDLLCSILTALRKALPPEISVSAKIRLLPSQEDTLKLVKRIVDTGVSAITVHCRTRNMRPREKALIGRMREIVEFVEGLDVDVAVIQNGDCLGFEDSKRLKQITGAHSFMIATAAESNPTSFDPYPFVDLEKTLLPQYIRLAKYLGIHWSNAKFCANQFKSPSPTLGKAGRLAIKQKLTEAKNYHMMDYLCAPWDGEKIMEEVLSVIDARPRGISVPTLPDQTVVQKEKREAELAGPLSVIDSNQDHSNFSEMLPMTAC